MAPPAPPLQPVTTGSRRIAQFPPRRTPEVLFNTSMYSVRPSVKDQVHRRLLRNVSLHQLLPRKEPRKRNQGILHVQDALLLLAHMRGINYDALEVGNRKSPLQNMSVTSGRYAWKAGGGGKLLTILQEIGQPGRRADGDSRAALVEHANLLLNLHVLGKLWAGRVRSESLCWVRCYLPV